jgi:hypothetical protein
VFVIRAIVFLMLSYETPLIQQQLHLLAIYACNAENERPGQLTRGLTASFSIRPSVGAVGTSLLKHLFLSCV